MISRRSFLAGILALGVAPAVVKASSIMRVRPVIANGVVKYIDEESFHNSTGEIVEFTRRRVSADGKTHTLECWWEDGNGFLLPSGRLDDPRGEYRGTSKLWGDHG